MNASGLITIVFTDLVGFTDLTSEIGDGAADELRRDHFADLRGAIESTGGSEVKTIGDAIMASYTSAADALAGSVAMQRSIELRNRRSDGPRLSMRIGASVGDASFEDGDWFGTPVIEASRLCAAADGGQILVSDVVRVLAGSRSDYELTALGERELKGLPEPISVCEVGWTFEMEPEGNAAVVPLPGFVETNPPFPFAGRPVERERLLTAWKESAEGTRRVVLVSGEPGVGKTRLVTETVTLAHQQGATLLWGRCAEELDVPYQPFVEALRHYVHSVPAERLRLELGALGGEMTRLIPDLDNLVPGLPEPVHTEAETERHRLFEAVGDLFESACAVAPMVLVLDDLHWGDKPSLLLLRHLLRRPASMPLLILATYRDTDLDRSHPLSEVLADLRREPGVERVDLQGLDAAEVTDFMEHAAGHSLEANALELAAAVHTETQGNPFFIGEMLRHLAESGLIVQRDGRWESDFTLADVGIPEGIREVVGRRLSRLSEASNTALTIGAVIGPEFDVAVVEALSGLDTDSVLDAVDEAAEASIIREVSGTFGRYAFAHALVRSTLYEELSTSRRVRMHWQVAEAIETRHASDLDDHLDELAHHYSEGALAGDPSKAVEFCRRAAIAANDDLAFEAAAQQFEHALASHDLLSNPDPAEKCDLQLARAIALRAASDPLQPEVAFAAAQTARSLDDAQRLAEAALSMTGPTSSRTGTLNDELIDLLESALDELGDQNLALRSRLLAGLAVELNWGPHGDRRRRFSSEALELARSTGDAEALRTALASAWTNIEGTQPYMDGMTQIYLEAESLGDDDPVSNVQIHRGLCAISAATGQPDEMRRRLSLEVEMAETIRQPRLIWSVRNDQAMVSIFEGDIEAAETQSLGAMAYAIDSGVPDDLVMGAMGVVMFLVRLAQGRVDEFVPNLADLVETQPGIPAWRVALSHALSESGRPDEAIEHVQFLTEDHCARVPHDIEYAVTLCLLGVLTRTVSLDEATISYIYSHLLPFAGTFNWTGQSLTIPNDQALGVLAARLEDFAASDAHFAAAIELCERAGARPYLAGAHLEWAHMLGERGEADAASVHARSALELGNQLGMTGRFGVVPQARRLLKELGA